MSNIIGTRTLIQSTDIDFLFNMATVIENLFEDALIEEFINGSDLIKRINSFGCDIYILQINEDTNLEELSELNLSQHKYKMIVFYDPKVTLPDLFKNNADLCLENTNDIEFMLNQLKTVFDKNDEMINYLRIRPQFFWRYNKTLVDIFLKLNDYKYVKIFHKNESYTKVDIDSYSSKVDYFHINKNDLKEFSDKLETMPYLVLDKENQSSEESVKLTHALLQDLVVNFGLPKKAVELAHGLTENILGNIDHHSDIFKQFLKMRDRKDYIYDHSYLLCIISTSLCKRMEWCSRSILEKLCLASFFHDITLTDPELAMIQDKAKLDFSKLNKKQIDQYTNHPVEASNLIKNSPDMPPDLDKIVLHHHQSPNYDSVPSNVPLNQVFPLAKIFIIAHEFVSRMYQNDFDPSKVDSIISDLELTYKVHTDFSSEISQLRQLFLE
jgi:HD-GYP domain-containing protein (c-di-GMP phosphodiesterase class II)